MASKRFHRIGLLCFGFLVWMMLPTTLYAQYGQIEINLDSDHYWEDDSVLVVLSFRQNTIKGFYLSRYESETVDSLIPGDYTIQVVYMGVRTSTYERVEVEDAKVTEIHIYRPWITTSDTGDCPYTEKVEYVLGARFGQPEAPYNVFLEEQLTVIQNFQWWPKPGKNVSLGMLMGGQADWAQFKSDTSLFPGMEEHDKERYFNLSANIGVISRLSFFDFREFYKLGMVVDVGAHYQFPLAFRHVYVDGDTKTRTNKLHRFNDVRAFVRIGYLPATLTLNYRVFDYVKPGYPQLPKWTLGLEFVIEQ